MFPWKKRRGPFDDQFGFDFDLGDDFQRIQEEMERMMEEARKGSKAQPGEFGPFVYGWSMRVGSDGKPRVEKFGNIPGKAGKMHEGIAEGVEEREPLTDIVEGNEDVKIMAELPGVDKKDIELEAGEESLFIDVDTHERRYSKELKLPCKVKPETTKANYNNGVLEVTIKRAESRKEKKVVKKIKID
jgi:HSP20 family protein